MLLLSVAAIALLSSASAEAQAGARPTPDADTHQEFLLAEFDPAKPTVTVFKDPLCGYCIAAMPRLEELSEYNVYLFWAPIFGQRSDFSINEIFRCENKVDKSIREVVVARKSPGCAGDIDGDELAVNLAMVNAYRINSVPAYYFQGARVSLDELLMRQMEHPPIDGVAVDWDRYRDAKIRRRPESHSIALLLDDDKEELLQVLDEKLLPQFVFTKSDPSTQQSYEELRLLLGLDGGEAGSFIVTRDGRVVEL